MKFKPNSKNYKYLYLTILVFKFIIKYKFLKILKLDFSRLKFLNLILI